MALLQKAQFPIALIGDGVSAAISFDMTPHYAGLGIPNFSTPTVLDVVDNYGISAGTFSQFGNVLTLTLNTAPAAGWAGSVNYTVRVQF